MRYFILIMAASLTLCSSAQRGYLDKSFGTNGKTLTKLGETSVYPKQTALSKDNKILVMANSAAPNIEMQLLRYHANGNLDNTFGNAGKLTIIDTAANSMTYSATPIGFALISEEKIMVLMSMRSNANGKILTRLKLVQYASNGKLDLNFGTNGQLEFQLLDTTLSIQSFHKTQDEKFIITGHINSSTYEGIFSMKFDVQGHLDKSYGTDGIRVVSLGLDNHFFEHSFIDQSDNLYLPIFSEYYPDNSSTYIVKLTAKGAYDNSFGANGICNITAFEVSDPRLFIDAEQNIFFTGYHYAVNSNFTALLVKLNSEGIPDRSFGNNGKAENPLNDLGGNMKSIQMLHTGEPVLAGTNSLSGKHMPTIIKYTKDGKIDLSFNFDGYIDINFNQNASSNGNLIEYIESTGNAVFIGSSSQNLALAAVKCHFGLTIPEIESKVGLYPNPSDGVFSINTEVKLSGFKVIDHLGRMIQSGDTKTIDLQQYPAGLYTVLLLGKQGLIQKTIIKKI